MEQIITKLVQEFEVGKLTRRQLVQNLTLVATAASAVGLAPAASAAEIGLKANSLHHVSFSVYDYAKTRDYLVNLLGMKVRDDVPAEKTCRLTFGDPSYSTYLVIRSLTREDPVKTPHVDHMRIVIADWDKPGQAPRPQDHTNITPDGMRVDLGGTI